MKRFMGWVVIAGGAVWAMSAAAQTDITISEPVETAPVRIYNGTLTDSLKAYKAPPDEPALTINKASADALSVNAPLGMDNGKPITGVLYPQDVLAISAETFPDILVSLAEEAMAHGESLAAEGAFDLVFKSDGFSRVNGYYDGQHISAGASQYLRPFGAELYGGYRISDGDFPIYEDKNYTNNRGEAKVGILFSLLKNRDYDKRRYTIDDTRLAASQASLEVLMTKIGVQQKALNAYWRWVALGHELKTYNELLKMAQARHENIVTKVNSGALSEVSITENMQNIISREIMVAEAKRKFEIAANNLSFYLRDENNNLMVPTEAQIPAEDNLRKITDIQIIISASDSEILEMRPELRDLRLAIERAQKNIQISENALKPDLGLKVEVSNDFGNIAEGGKSRDSTDVIIGFEYKMPFQRREGRGKVQKAQAKMRAAQYKLQKVEQQITLELENTLIDLNTAINLVKLSGNEVKQASRMVEAEREKFELGASDFFLINMREEKAANAKIRAIRSILNGRMAETKYNAATMNLDALGLDAQSLN